MQWLNDEVHSDQKESWHHSILVRGFHLAVTLSDQSDESHCNWDLISHCFLGFVGGLKLGTAARCVVAAEIVVRCSKG